MKLLPAVHPTRLAVLALATLMTGCSTVDGLFSSDKTDYRNTAAKAKPLEVPPDLTQLTRESRYQPQGGVVSAAAAGAQPAPAAATGSAPATVALSSLSGMRVERLGQERWLVVPQAPELLWPRVKAFWDKRGFALESENATAGVMRTQWAENRTKLPQDVVRRTIGRLLDSFYDTGERDQYSTRIERVAGGSEIYISHRGAHEVYTDERRETTTWRARPNDPQLEAEMLSQLMVDLGSMAEPAKAATAAATEAPGPDKPVPSADATSLVVQEPFDRAWRRVGLALDRGGFTVEDRDRTAGLYYVRYVDPKSVGKEEPGFWAKLWGDKTNPQAALRYRIALKPTGEKTTVSVQSSTGAAETGENAKRIVALLVNGLR
ncbi:MAG: outer membrane protein assembly factor BamC [Rubrivivax sp.]|nr:outer membrane protein assembly factor BamC [Rubrivivax sp.]